MHVGELPLVLFTLLTQMSVGSFVVLGAVQVLARRRYPAATVDRLSDPALYAIGPVMVAALAVSLLHLGNPVNLLNVLNNLGSSWLSREILLGCVFTALGAGFALCQWRRWLTPGIRQAVAAVTALVGLAFVWASAQVYLIPTVPAWNTWTTPVAFFATTSLLGCLAVGATFVVAASLRARRPGAEGAERADGAEAVLDAMLRSSLRGIGLASIGVLAVELLVLPAWLLGLANDGSPAATAAAAALTAGGWLHLRLVLAVLGAGVLALFLYRAAAAGGRRLLLVTASSAFVLVLVAETVGRVQFFESYARIGI
ncbi:dimethyl sulfoxide reductase anchor subunit family protein [Cellulosimicrobium cellulans]|uniref:dimethyl sulfoxide reductase anchor subunit family protein n=1 Tax=Cellulosimicrobium cellulans TaxID=1710 RepID=UPI00130DBFE3|nr:DmsC/YnfH family molybdoenzyme membrane anchor subunit [Cellulosimicrobium cellulans]